MQSKKKASKTVFLIMIVMIISRLLGFVREVIMTNKFGRGMETDAFFAAFTIPDMMYYLLIGGALSSAFIPVFTSYLSKNEEKEAWRVASTFINIVVISLVVLSILGIIFAPQLVPLVAFGFKGEQLDLTISLSRMMFPAVTFTALAGLGTGILNSYKIFNAPSIGPIIYNIGIIFGTLFLSNEFGIYGMAMGVVLGAIGNAFYQFAFIIKRAKYYRLKIELKHEGVKKIFKLIIPTLIGLSVTQINLVVNQNVASILSHGSITALRLANRIMQLPLGIFAMSIATVIFPIITSKIALDDIDGFKDTFAMGLKNIFFITIPCAFGLTVLGLQFIKVLFVRGAFTPKDAIITHQALVAYMPGLIAQSGIQILTRGFYATLDTKTPVKVSIFIVIINLVLNLIFVNIAKFKGVAPLAFAYSLTSIINMFLLGYYLSKKMNGIRGRAIAMSVFKTIICSLVMFIVLLGFRYLFISYENSSVVYIQIGIFLVEILIGAIIFTLSAFILKMKELDYVKSLVIKK